MDSVDDNIGKVAKVITKRRVDKSDTSACCSCMLSEARAK